MNYAVADREKGILPEVDKEQDRHCENDRIESYWRSGIPKTPGWYWVWGPGLWPQVIEAVYTTGKGKIAYHDRHTKGSNAPIWTHYNGPIEPPEDPAAVMRRFYKEWPQKKGKKVVQSS